MDSRIKHALDRSAIAIDRATKGSCQRLEAMFGLEADAAVAKLVPFGSFEELKLTMGKGRLGKALAGTAASAAGFAMHSTESLKQPLWPLKTLVAFGTDDKEIA